MCVRERLSAALEIFRRLGASKEAGPGERSGNSAARSRRSAEGPLRLFLSGALDVFLGGFGVVVAQGTARHGVFDLVVPTGLFVYDDRVVALSDLLYGVLCSAVLAQLASLPAPRPQRRPKPGAANAVGLQSTSDGLAEPAEQVRA